MVTKNGKPGILLVVVRQDSTVNSEDLCGEIEYIHNNPVEAGLVLRPECWQYSSANEINKIDVLLP